MRISAKNLSQRAGARLILHDVSLEVASGETLGLIGPNGSGKSTLLRLLAGLAGRRRGSGQVELDGIALPQLSRREIAQRIAFVAQQAETTEALSVRDVVELGRTPWLSPLAPFSAKDAAICRQALHHLGMEQMSAQAWSTLSGGERQRVQIARALAQRPRLMLLDEPTNHLDVHHQLSLLRLVSDLPVTVVIALHDLNQAMGCDRLAVMQDGRLAAIGRPKEVLTPARLAQIFRVNAHALSDAQDPQNRQPQFRFLPLDVLSPKSSA